MFKTILAVFLGITLLSLASAQIAGDKVTTLKGYDPNAFELYSGFLSITTDKKIHYMFSKSTNKDANVPVVLWLNGGPGCSSLEGFFSEIGPLVFNGEATDLSPNPNTWLAYAHLLFIEAPVNVGFSTGPADSVYSDVTTAEDMYAAVKLFFQGFAPYQGNDFWIAGESYAGIYIPNLAQQILQKNDATLTIKLKGILPGNPVTDSYYLQSQHPAADFFFYHHLITEEVYNGFKSSCPTSSQGLASPACNYFSTLMNQQTDNINPYSIYGYCYPDSLDEIVKPKTPSRYAPWYKMGYDVGSPCTTTRGWRLFLNDLDNQKSLNIVGADATTALSWIDCSDVVGNNYVWSEGSMPAYEYLLKQGIVIWVLSGDTDAVVPFTDTLAWITKLNLPVTEKWQPWSVGGQVGGFFQHYKSADQAYGLKYVSVRGAGHMIPSYKPQESLTILTSILSSNHTLPTDF